MKNAGKACNNRLYRHIRTFEKIIKNYFVIYGKIQKKLEADIRCPLEYGLWWQMEIAYYMRAFRQQKTALQRDTERNV